MNLPARANADLFFAETDGEPVKVKRLYVSISVPMVPDKLQDALSCRMVEAFRVLTEEVFVDMQDDTTKLERRVVLSSSGAEKVVRAYSRLAAIFCFVDRFFCLQDDWFDYFIFELSRTSPPLALRAKINGEVLYDGVIVARGQNR